MKNLPFIVIAFLACDFLLPLLYLANWWGLGASSHTLTTLLDLGGEANLPTWYSSMQLFVVAMILSACVYVRWSESKTVPWVLVLLAGLFAALSLDEIAQIHEMIGFRTDVLLPGGDRRHSIFGQTGVWMFVLGIPIFAGVLALVFRLKKLLRGQGRIVRIFFAATVVYFGSALGLEALVNFIPAGGLASALQVCLEECGEMTGATLYLWGAYELARFYGLTITLARSPVTEEA